MDLSAESISLAPLRAALSGYHSCGHMPVEIISPQRCMGLQDFNFI